VLQGVTTVAEAVSFSLSLQLGVTIVNTVGGMFAMLLLFRSHKPLDAVRSGFALARRRY
jgi:hypothetical protein